jgi:CBS-domain-containing membrane protein
MDPDPDETGSATGPGGIDVTGAATRSVRTRARERYSVLGAGGYAFILCLLVLAVAGCVGLLLHQPWLFPSLGPTAMLFFESPDQESARPLNTLIGHVVGILVGLGCLWMFGMSGAPPAPVGGLTTGYVAAGTLSVAMTTLALTLLRRPIRRPARAPSSSASAS